MLNCLGPIALTSVIDCDHTAIGLPPVMSAVFVLVVLVENGRHEGISEIPLVPH
jgi:coenzyme F420-reducing hydrogenase gamma subunit